MRIINFLLCFFLLINNSFAAISASNLWEFNPSATGSMVNGGGFNTANANFPTDGSWTSANTSAPVLTSATYTFVAGDVGAWIYSKTTSLPGFYKIASVSAGAATVNGTIGAAEVIDSVTGRWTPSTVVGVDSSSSVSSKTYGVDYSRGTASNSNVADLASVGASTTTTSVSNPWSPVSVGNMLHITTTGTGAHCVVGWYEIVSESLVSSVVLDRTPNDGTAGVACTGRTGGALDFAGSLGDAFFEQIMGGNNLFIKSGSYSAIGGSLSISSTNSTSTNPSNVFGYTTVRGDSTTGSNRPSILATTTFTMGQYINFYNLQLSTNAVSGYTFGTGASLGNLKGINTSTSANRIAISIGGDSVGWNLEGTSQLGIGINMNASGAKCIVCYAHDSDVGFTLASSRNLLSFSISESNKTAAVNITNTSAFATIKNNTLYGSEAKIGTGILINASVPGSFIANNIIYGFTTGISQSTAQLFTNMGAYNDFFNNTSDVSNYTKDITDLALNPTFTSASQLTGSTATTSGSVLTQSGGNFSAVTDNRDYLRVVSGTGVTVGQYLITSHTSTTLTVNNALGTSSGGDVVWVVPYAHNFSIGTNLKAQGFPGAFPAGLTTGYEDIGAVQRQESGSGSGGFFIQ